MLCHRSFSALILSLALCGCSGDSRSPAELALAAAAPQDYEALIAARTLVEEEETVHRAAPDEWMLVQTLEALDHAAPQELRLAIVASLPSLEEVAEAAPEQWSDFARAFERVFEGRNPTGWRDVFLEPVLQTVAEAAPKEWEAYVLALAVRASARNRLKEAAPDAWAAYEATTSPSRGEVPFSSFGFFNLEKEILREWGRSGQR